MAGSTNFKKQKAGDYPVGYYWKRVCHVTDDRERYTHLQTVLKKTQATAMHVITPEYTQTILSFLRGSHNDEIKILTLRILSYLENPVLLMLVKNGLIDAVKGLFALEAPIDSSPAGILRFHLLCEALNLIYKFSEKNLELMLKCGVQKSSYSLLDQNNSNLFQFGPDSLDSFTRLTNKDLIGMCTEHTSGDIDTVCKKYFGVDLSNVLVPKVLCEISLYDTSDPNNDRDILKELKREGAVWPSISQEKDGSNGSGSEGESDDPNEGSQEDSGSNGEPPSEPPSGPPSGPPSEADIWKDVTVTCPIDGKYFWAHVFVNTTTATEEIKEILANWPLKSRQMLRGPPKPGIFVAAPSSEIGMHRAQVIDVMGESVQLFDLDFGSLSWVPWKQCFLLTPNMNMKRFPPQAKLCYLKGAHPPPASIDLIGSALCVLIKLTSHTVYLGTYFMKSKFFAKLRSLLYVPSHAIRLKVVFVIMNLAYSPVVRQELAKSGVLHALVDVIGELIQKQQHSAEDTEMLRYTLKVITNLLYDSPDNKTLFVEETMGIEYLLELCKNNDLEKEAASALRVFMGNVNITEATSKPQGQLHEVERARQKSKERLAGRSGSRSRSNQQPGNRSRSRSGARSQFRGSRDDAVFGQLSMKGLHLQDSSDDEIGPENSLLRPQLASGNASPKAVTVDPVDPNATTYEHGVLFPYSTDEKHDIFAQKNLSRIIGENLALVIVSLLNTSLEGSIFVGITEEGYVQGVLSNRDEREGFRLGVDHLATDDIKPPLLHNQYKVIFHPVVKNNVTISHVLEVKVKVNQKILYKTQGKIYVRQGTDIILMNVPDYHIMCVRQEEATYLNKIKIMKLELEQLREQLKK